MSSISAYKRKETTPLLPAANLLCAGQEFVLPSWLRYSSETRDSNLDQRSNLSIVAKVPDGSVGSLFKARISERASKIILGSVGVNHPQPSVLPVEVGDKRLTGFGDQCDLAINYKKITFPNFGIVLLLSTTSRSAWTVSKIGLKSADLFEVFSSGLLRSEFKPVPLGEKIPDLDVKMLLNIARPHNDTTKAEIIVSRFAQRFRYSQWLKGCRLPEIFYDPRAVDENKR